MNSKEKVLRAFGKIKGLPDRVPIQFDLCRHLADYFGKELGIPVYYTENLYGDVTYRISANELRVAMGSDVVITGASVSDIIESAWIASRWDLALNKSFHDYCKRMEPNKAIVRIARKLLNRIRFVLKNNQPYVCSVIK